MNLWERQSFTRCNSDSNQENDRTDRSGNDRTQRCCVLCYPNYDLCHPYQSQNSEHFIDMIISFIGTKRDSVLFSIAHLM